MEKLCVNMLNDSNYMALITILDYEMVLSQSLKEITFESSANHPKHVLVDLALKSGINQYRFVEFNVNDSGKIILESHQYVLPDELYVDPANRYLREKKAIVLNSMLTDTQKKELFNIS